MHLEWRLVHESGRMHVCQYIICLSGQPPPIDTSMSSDSLSCNCMTRFTAHVLALLADMK